MFDVDMIGFYLLSHIQTCHSRCPQRRLSILDLILEYQSSSIWCGLFNAPRTNSIYSAGSTTSQLSLLSEDEGILF